jgi:hypothetical protein
MKLYFIVDAKGVPLDIGDGTPGYHVAYAHREDAEWDAEGSNDPDVHGFSNPKPYSVREFDVPETFLGYFHLHVHNPPVRHKDMAAILDVKDPEERDRLLQVVLSRE